MKHINNYFNNSQKKKIYYQAWLPDRTPKAIVLIIHGLAEHSGRYSELASELLKSQYGVYGVDHPGHGNSEGRRVFISEFDIYINTVRQYYKIIRKSHPTLPIFILGHSMGGLITSSYLLQYQSDFSGAILSSPALQPPRNITNTIIFLGKIISAIAPKLGVMKLNSGHISTSQTVKDSYKNDPLVYRGRVTARLSSEMLTAMNNIFTNIKQINLPILIMQGGEDKIVNPDGAQNFYNNISSSDKELTVYKGLYHEILNDPANKEILQDLKSWLNKHC